MRINVAKKKIMVSKIKNTHLLRRRHVCIKHLLNSHYNQASVPVIENSVLALLNQYQSNISCKITAYARYNNNNTI